MVAAFPTLMNAVINKGRVYEESLDKFGFETDKDGNGNEVVRDAGISQESLQCSKWLTHPQQVELRKQCICELKLKQMKKHKSENSKHIENVNANKNAIQKLVQILNQDGYQFAVGANKFAESHLSLCELRHFYRLYCNELNAIIIAHDSSIKLKKDLPKKGTIKEVEHGQWTKLSLAFNC